MTITDEFLWPARNVAEYAYCPRLFYYMQVEGIFLPSEDTEKGKAVHRKTDRPSAAQKEDGTDSPDRPKVVRSLVLTSKTLGLTATLDLAEISGMTAVPIEYRKGAPHRSAMSPPPDEIGEADDPPLFKPEPWPTDRIQLGLQVILLKEAGYEVPKAILYYASEKLRLEVLVNDGLEKDALAVLESAKACSQGHRPLPLLNDSRCLRCSLQPICLPDEVNHQRTEGTTAQISPRKIWPPRAEGIHVVVQQKGVKVGVRGMALRTVDQEGTLIREVPMASVESVSLLGSVQISTQAIHVLADRGIPVAFLSAAGRLVSILEPNDSISIETRKAQLRGLEDPTACLELSRALIAAKISNQRTLLLRNHPVLSAGIPKILTEEVRQALQAKSLEELRGYEGHAAAVYFRYFGGMIKGPLGEQFDANGRQRRPPPDPLNSCLSMAYSILVRECAAACRLASLEPSMGAFHVSRPGRPALALDLMEPFRPLIADSVAVSLFNRCELTEGHFLRTAAGCMFTDAGRKAFFGAYGRRMETEVTHPIFGYKLSYRRMLVLHARMIAAWLVGDIKTLSFLTTR